MVSDFSGRWFAKLDESVFVSRTPRRLSAEITQSAERLHVEMRVSFDGSDDSRMVFDASIVDGDELRSGSVALARWMGSDLVVEMCFESGGEEVALRERWSLSGDGTRLTMAHKHDALAGQKVIFDRQ
jgi:hypothetical protein